MEASMEFPKYEEYKASGVEWLGEIPSHWSVTRNLGLFDERKEVNQPEMELLAVTIKKGVIKQSEITTKKDSSNDDKSKYKVVRKGDLAYNKMRMWQGAIGESKYDGIVSPAYIILNTRNRLYSRYFHYLYRTEQFIKEANRNSYGLCDDMNSLRYEHFKTIYSPTPPAKDVSRIIDFLDHKTAEIDAAIAKKQELIELLKEQKAILINQAVTKGLNPNVKMKDSGVAWIGEIPEHWTCTRLGYYARVSNGSTPSRDNPRYWNNGTINWLSSGKVNDFEVSAPSELVTEAALKNTALRLYPKGTVIIGIVGQGKTRGTTAITRIECCINQNMAAIETDSRLNPDYLHRYLFQTYHNIRMMGKGSNQEALNCEIVRSIKTCVPPEDEQDQIVQHIREYERLFSKSLSGINREIERLQEFKQTLITHTTTGKIKV